MSKFECKVSDLNNENENENKNENSNIETKNVAKQELKLSSVREDNSKSVIKELSILDKLLSEKNIKMAFLISLSHFILHSDQGMEFINSKVPSIFISPTQLNMFGKFVFGIIISIVFIVYFSFFQDP
jgi:hypothetical protein